ncbi:hypothetical protein DUNSADRAFT_18784 [Dunaliella salina]|uniref:Uncharacterized protein n=1 Tax=Dunaliella salina TaxID=3046 RepID=A0ABQ7FZH8_DUNSA|nr:hypothetical protein DUNSADRAFT_18784 [Dunaliella salina]|eukprot:KAF5827760.1 hypothetical protein DUNSADRAFT_18784 [Dunaliella salina]
MGLLVFCMLQGLLALALAQGQDSSSCSCDAVKEQLASTQAQLGQKSNELYAVQLQLWERTNELSQKTSELSQKTAELSQKELELQRARTASQDLSLAAVAKALSGALKNKIQSLKGELLIIIEEAKQGKFDRARVLGLDLMQATNNLWRGASSSVYAFLATEAAPFVSKVKAANQELMAILTLQLRAVPSLRPYADPAFVQLLVYAIFGLPILLLVILPLALLLSTRKAEDEAPQSQKRGNKGKGRSRPA